MASPLTAGFCELAHRSDESPEGVQPILQVLSVKKIAAVGASTDRFRSAASLATLSSDTKQHRIILSDGKYFIQAMLATQLNHYVENKELEKNVVIKLTQFVTNAVQGRR